MKWPKKYVLLFFVLTAAFFNSSFIALHPKNNIKVEITGLRNNLGNIKMGVYISRERFEQKKDSKIITIEKQQMHNQKVIYSFYLEPGTYGLSILDDENDNGKMDFNMFGMPKEGFGFSNYYHSGFLMPKFQSFSFTVLAGEEKKVNIKLRYI